MSKPWDGLSAPYSTIVADPPWRYEQGGPRSEPDPTSGRVARFHPPPYPTMTVAEIAALPVADLADRHAHLYLWTTNRYLRDAFDVAKAWGFKHSQTLTWCKPPRGIGPGGAFSNTTEFVLYCRRGSLPYQTRIDTTWWQWKRRAHSVKPDEFMDVVERISPGPYVELFARAARPGWDRWGNQAPIHG